MPLVLSSMTYKCIQMQLRYSFVSYTFLCYFGPPTFKQAPQSLSKLVDKWRQYYSFLNRHKAVTCNLLTGCWITGKENVEVLTTTGLLNSQEGHSIGNRQKVHSAVQCGVLCLCRFIQFTGCDQPVQHSHWPEHAIDWLP